MKEKIKNLFWLVIFQLSAISGFTANTDTLYVSPNPFDSLGVIHFDLLQNDTVSLDVYNNLGQKLITYFDKALLPGGSYAVDFVADTLVHGVYHVMLDINSTQSLHVLAIHAPVGIKDNGDAKHPRSMFPNPTTGLLTIPYDGIKTIVVTDLAGHVLRSLTLSARTFTLSGLGNGTYLVTVMSVSGVILTTQSINLFDR